MGLLHKVAQLQDSVGHSALPAPVSGQNLQMDPNKIGSYHRELVSVEVRLGKGEVVRLTKTSELEAYADELLERATSRHAPPLLHSMLKEKQVVPRRRNLQAFYSSQLLTTPRRWSLNALPQAS